MKITESQLRNIIKQELSKLLNEAMTQQTSNLLANLQFRSIPAPQGVDVAKFNGKFNGPVETTEPATGKPRTFFAFVHNNEYYITMYYNSYKGNTWDSAWSKIQADLKLTEDKQLPARFR